MIVKSASLLCTISRVRIKTKCISSRENFINITIIDNNFEKVWVSNRAYNLSPDSVVRFRVSKIDFKQIRTRNSAWQERAMIAFAGFLVENDATWLKPERPNCIRRHGCCILKFHIQQSRYSNNALIGIILSAPSVPRVSICNKKSIYPHDALSLPPPVRQPVSPIPTLLCSRSWYGWWRELFFIHMCIPLTGWTRVGTQMREPMF